MPIHVDGRLWGMIAVGSGIEPLPPDTEHRMTEFTDLIATAIAKAQSRIGLMASRARAWWRRRVKCAGESSEIYTTVLNSDSSDWL